MSEVQAPPAQRLQSVDALRGLIMMVMALDHARAFIAREHPFEIWSAPLAVYDTVLPFATRLVTHLCAPGFFFLMGVGMSFLATARGRSGWSTGRTMRFFIARGMLLLLVEQVLENPAWILGMMGASGPNPSGGGPMIMLGVLYALSGAMLFWSTLIAAPVVVVVAISLTAILATQVLIPAPSQAGTAFSLAAHLLLIPGKTGIWFVLYPLVPWLGLCGLGIAFGRSLAAEQQASARRALIGGLILLGLFVTIRLGGGFGNIHVPVPSGWIGFLTLTKYPPSLAFITLTLGMNLLLLSAFLGLAPGVLQRWGKPLLVFGRTALFFYVVHLYLYAVIGLAFPHGASIATVYPYWALGLVILYPLCQRYEGFKSTTATDSLWRFF